MLKAQGNTGGVSVLSASGVSAPRSSVNGAGDATFQALATITIPANQMGANGLLRVDATLSCTNSANAKSFVIRFGSSIVYTASLTSQTGGRTSLVIQNRNALNSQVTSLNTGQVSQAGSTTGTVPATFSVDTSVNQTLEIGGNWGGATASETLALERYSVEILRA